jgi:hypothetical protein
VHNEELKRRADPWRDRRVDHITSRGLGWLQVEATKVLDRYEGNTKFMLGLQRQMRTVYYFMPTTKQARVVLRIARQEGLKSGACTPVASPSGKTPSG